MATSAAATAASIANTAPDVPAAMTGVVDARVRATASRPAGVAPCLPAVASTSAVATSRAEAGHAGDWSMSLTLRSGPFGPCPAIHRARRGAAQTAHRNCSILEDVTISQPAAAPRLSRADGSPLRILVVDDEASLTDLLSMALRYEGWDVKSANGGQEALATAREWKPDAMVLDVMMPDLDGLQVLGRLRQNNDDTPVLFLTAKDSVEDRVTGLTAGGDDYVTKPFSLEEVVARLRGLIRRSQISISEAGDSRIVVGDLVLDEESYEVSRAGRPIELTATEFELLRFLMRNPRRVLSKAQILDRVWSYDFGGKSSVVEIYISYLRKKIDAGETPMIHTVRGVGYVIKPTS